MAFILLHKRGVILLITTKQIGIIDECVFFSNGAVHCIKSIQSEILFCSLYLSNTRIFTKSISWTLQNTRKYN